jgi:hypothetical protein
MTAPDDNDRHRDGTLPADPAEGCGPPVPPGYKGPVLVQDTREPAVEAGDVADAVFRPFVWGKCPRDTPYSERPRVVLPYMRHKLDVGDYSLPGLVHRVALERKSGPDLLATLFGDGVDSVGERAANLDRFRAEIERAYHAHYELFAIVCEASVGWLFTEASRRFKTYGKSFDPCAVRAILRGFAVDLACPTLWCGSKGAAEEEVGATLARVWEQASGGKAAKKAVGRGYAIPWLGALEGVTNTVTDGTASQP